MCSAINVVCVGQINLAANTADAKFKMKGFSAAGQDICDAIESILKQPDDPKVEDYDDEGLQSVRWLELLLNSIRLCLCAGNGENYMPTFAAGSEKSCRVSQHCIVTLPS
jgi:hypothetical protein